MKRLLLVLILTISFQSCSKADDVRDFEIEGISIGDSLLDYFDKKEIYNNKPNYYNDNEFSTFELNSYKNAKTYDGLQVIYLSKDRKFKIFSISGVLSCKNSFNNCKNKWKKILSDLTNSFKDTSNIVNNGVFSHGADKTGNSKAYQVVFEFINGDRITLEMTNWTEEMGYTDNLRVNIDTKRFVTWLNTKAY